MVQVRQHNGGNNAGAMILTTPKQHEGKEISRIMTMTPEQQGQQRRAILAMESAQQGQQHHCDNSKDACTLMMAMMPS